MAIHPCGPQKIADIFADHGIHLTRQEARFLDIVLGRERLVLFREFAERLWAGEDGGPLSINGPLNLLAYKCRRKIRSGRIPWRLENEYRRGYRLRYKR